MWRKTENSHGSPAVLARSPSAPPGRSLPQVTSEVRAARRVGCWTSVCAGALIPVRFVRGHKTVFAGDPSFPRHSQALLGQIPTDTGSTAARPAARGRLQTGRCERQSGPLVPPLSRCFPRSGLPPGAAPWCECRVGSCPCRQRAQTHKHKPTPPSDKGCGAKCQAGEPWVRRRPACRVSDGPLPLACATVSGPAGSQIRGGPCDSGRGASVCGLALN